MVTSGCGLPFSSEGTARLYVPAMFFY
uniref:Uncharacterized protein n=1 Tax=Amphimedon queenslandica TaxID=400682 RepID=A0A1X7VRR5_AMPQE